MMKKYSVHLDIKTFYSSLESKKLQQDPLINKSPHYVYIRYIYVIAVGLLIFPLPFIFLYTKVLVKVPSIASLGTTKSSISFLFQLFLLSIYLISYPFFHKKELLLKKIDQQFRKKQYVTLSRYQKRLYSEWVTTEIKNCNTLFAILSYIQEKEPLIITRRKKHGLTQLKHSLDQKIPQNNDLEYLLNAKMMKTKKIYLMDQVNYILEQELKKITSLFEAQLLGDIISYELINYRIIENTLEIDIIIQSEKDGQTVKTPSTLHRDIFHFLQIQEPPNMA